MNQGVSIVLCCYNSTLRLKPTLEHLANQIVSIHFGCEILLVDNNSSDNTSLFAKEIWLALNSSIPLRIVSEPIAGLSFARSTGVKAAKYDLILFCDDDNWLNEHYVQRSFEIMSANPIIAALGGWSEAALPLEKLPSWFSDYQLGYAVGRQSSRSGDVTDKGWLWGAGLVVRKAIFLKAFSRVGSLLMDRKGEHLTSHGDVEICKRIILLGYRLYYSEELFFKHDIPENRLTEVYRNNLFKGFETGTEIIYLYNKQITINNLGYSKKLRIVLSMILKLLRKIIFQLRFNNLQQEIENIYLYTGIKFGSINKNVVAIKKIG